MLKRYALFSYFEHYPEGGWDDFVDTFETVAAATERGQSLLVRSFDGRTTINFFDVIDLQTGQKVAEG